jgi:hypothetical protein
MAVTSENTLDAHADAAARREADKRRRHHRRRIRAAGNPRARKWQSIAWLYAELKRHSDLESALLVEAIAYQLNAGWTPKRAPDEEVAA